MSTAAVRLVLIDRDGVINRDSDQYIKSVAEWVPLPGSLEAIAELTRAGFNVAVVTNQSGIGRGLFSESMLAAIHAGMMRAVEAVGGRIDAIFYCPHLPDAGCLCRKPEPGMLLQAAAKFGVKPGEVTFVGDKLSDVEAATRAGVRPIVVGPKRPEGIDASIAHFPDLAAAARQLISENGTP